MERKFIDESRYVKSSVSKGKNRRRNISNNTKYKKEKNKIQEIKPSDKEKKITKHSKKTKTIRKIIPAIRVILCVILIAFIAIVSRILTKKEGEKILPAFFSTNRIKNNDQTITIAIYGDNNLLGDVDNIVLSELEQYIYPVLLRVGVDYDLVYSEASAVEKNSNTEYVISLNQKSEITPQDIENEINSLRASVNKNSHKVENVENVEVISGKKLKIVLRQDDEYFAYNLNFPIKGKTTSNCIYSIDSSNSNKNQLIINRSENARADLIKCIKIVNIAGESEAVQKYKEGNIDMFFTNSDNIGKALGRYEYNMQSYKSGENMFLVFNPISGKVSKKEIRQAIVYSIDRDIINKDVLPINSSKIDLPYIYDDIRYKYDIYASENLLLSNGYIKQNGMYYDGNGSQFMLELLVNKDDEEKMAIAIAIKDSLLAGGIGVNITELSKDKIEAKINRGEYDIALTTMYLNENPNINNIKDIISINSSVKEKIELTHTSKGPSLKEQISQIKQKLSDNVAIFGILSKDVSVIYRKNINMFEDMEYMSLYNKMSIKTDEKR